MLLLRILLIVSAGVVPSLSIPTSSLNGGQAAEGLSGRLRGFRLRMNSNDLLDLGPGNHVPSEPTGIHEIQTSEVGAEKAGGIIGTDLIDRPASHRDLRSRPKDEVRPASDDEKGSSSDDESVSSSDDEAESPSDDEDLTSVVRGPPRGPMEILYKCAIIPAAVLGFVTALLADPVSGLLRPYHV
ncbi:hypothetical protein MJO28_008489 [Puccinia striiformis f. sp. tritici]|uniref:Uncharacterized protein n=4 Tax=Puccinia striiformis TaxID=27350 RepID=A0A0L0VG32_9BASI|nr:hypothetical protein Pst134EB_016561 [Puccinia striiformis f. sp. tritici]KAI7949668.1 hypothetical protein MJO28_008489 [Puccinia striiformis f. sp. tritici]KNE98252.1 hypothetical protein PSTG_08524 [Puccinia striiformis f. sp. tritici PST-78]POW04527.1 hypothetical protein PSTT_10343 [Puccinia striiformis]POW21215.1 hypothetical protein PSHT_02693 [Puccinia striiformis]